MSLDLRRRAREDGARVILSGVGGDEWIGIPYAGLYYAEELQQGHWLEALDCFSADRKALGSREALWWVLRHGIGPLLLPTPVKTGLKRIFGTPQRQKDWLSPRFLQLLQDRKEKAEALPRPAFVRRGQNLQYNVLMDAYSTHARDMENRFASLLGLELRTPFNSAAIVQLAFSTPERLRTQGRVTKKLHRRAFQNFLPKDVIERTTKADFMGLFQRQLADVDENAFGALFKTRAEWLTEQSVIELFRQYKQGHGAGVAEWIFSVHTRL